MDHNLQHLKLRNDKTDYTAKYMESGSNTKKHLVLKKKSGRHKLIQNRPK